MSHTQHSPSTRVRAALAAAALGLLTAGAALAPATAADEVAAECDGLATTAADYQAELECAAAATEGDQTIVIDANFDIPAAAQNVYSGTQNLTIVGAHGDITVTGPGQAEAVDSGVGMFLEVSANEYTHANVTVRGLTLTQFSSAGAILNYSYGTLSLTDVTVSGNGVLATPGGAGSFPFGAAVASLGDIVIADSDFSGNAGGLGGAVSTWPVLVSGGPGEGDPQEPPTVSVTNSSFWANEAVAGAAIFSFGNTEVSASTFADNIAETGGAVASFGPTAQFSGSTFEDNVATPMSAVEGYIEGGALAVDGDITITASEFSGNVSDGIGGAIAFSVGAEDQQPSLAIIDTLLFGNAAADAGGAVWFEGDLEVSGSTFMHNESEAGPAAIALTASSDDHVGITNSTFLTNSSDARAPAVAVVGAGAVEVTHATFLWNSSAGDSTNLGVDEVGSTTVKASVWAPRGDAPSCNIGGELVTAANFDEDGSCTADWSGQGDIGQDLDPYEWWVPAIATDDPFFAMDTSGPTPVVVPDYDSPVVDAVPAGVTDTLVDQRGVTRPQGEAKDIGAVELEPEADVPPAGELIEFEVVTDAGTIEGTASPALAVTDVEWIATGDLANPPPADTMFPYGAAGFTVEVPQPGDSVEITLTAPRPFTTVLKSADGAWSKVAGATFSNNGTTVTYTLTDGGELDEDGEANGFIVDPVALAVQGTFAG